jgi:hypothetical protein
MRRACSRCRCCADAFSCPGRAKRAPLRERNETRDPAQESRSAIHSCRPRSTQVGFTRLASSNCRSRASPRSVSRYARPGHERAKSRLAHEPLAVAAFTMSNSAVLFVPAARCCARVSPSLRMCLRFRVRRPAHEGFGASGRRDSSDSVPPMRGGWSADRRTHSFGRACAARPPGPGATGTPLGAPPWRFSDADPRSRLPAVEPEPQRLPAPRHKAWRSGSGPPALRFAPQRGTPLLAPSFRIVSRKRPSEPGCESCTTNSIRSQYQSRSVVR